MAYQFRFKTQVVGFDGKMVGLDGKKVVRFDGRFSLSIEGFHQ